MRHTLVFCALAELLPVPSESNTIFFDISGPSVN
jgi:hypothetical protein